MNPRITPKDKALIKGAVRRVFSRSELRRSILEAAIIEGYSDPKRPRVKKWFKCGICGEPEAVSYAEIDHKLPIQAILSLTNEDISWDNLVDKIWCEPSNLQALDKKCHKAKSKQENKLRREHRKKCQST